jgi:hypothetical protein
MLPIRRIALSCWALSLTASLYAAAPTPWIPSLPSGAGSSLNNNTGGMNGPQNGKNQANTNTPNNTAPSLQTTLQVFQDVTYKKLSAKADQGTFADMDDSQDTQNSVFHLFEGAP